MQLFVRSMTGKVITVQFTPENTVGQIKEAIQLQDGTPIEQQHLLFE
jgi:hypothetical protein